MGTFWTGYCNSRGSGRCSKVEDRNEVEWGSSAAECHRGYDLWGCRDGGVFEQGDDVDAGRCDFYGNVSALVLLLHSAVFESWI